MQRPEAEQAPRGAGNPPRAFDHTGADSSFHPLVQATMQRLEVPLPRVEQIAGRASGQPVVEELIGGGSAVDPLLFGGFE